ncbi:hypothetical protein [Facklamia hominis]|uniref:Uncharacterized protein n=1 Tax=Facklamia hominis TaxID=178214 RepID=A0AAJ1Q4V2_9LACT|nr:hypothetical protein [Facklamia hominis]MDK7186884.1 hypothetical protein [Facklamia hominis]
MITEILKDEELTEYLSEMVKDGCEINLQVQCEIERWLKGYITHSEMMSHLEKEWKFQRRQRDVI